MIQELLGGERKMSLNGGGVVLQNTPPPPSSHSPSSSTITNNTPNPDQNKTILRCPRCDSSNTKFCYYNNYNLTQPRHFCKTCRRYWTKGGTLRNVPIGGGCRKNKNPCISTPIGKSVGVNKVAKIGIQYGFDHHEFSSNDINNNSNPLLWDSPQNSHILALLRSTQNPNLNLNPHLNSNHAVGSSITVKDEGRYSTGCNLTNDSSVTTVAFNALTLGLDPFISQVPSFWRNNQIQTQQQNGFNINVVGEVVHQNNGIQDLYERLRSSSNSNNYGPDHATSSASVLDSAPVGGGGGNGFGYWSSAYSTWSSDLPATNGAYP